MHLSFQFPSFFRKRGRARGVGGGNLLSVKNLKQAQSFAVCISLIRGIFLFREESLNLFPASVKEAAALTKNKDFWEQFKQCLWTRFYYSVNICQNFKIKDFWIDLYNALQNTYIIGRVCQVLNIHGSVFFSLPTKKNSFRMNSFLFLKNSWSTICNIKFTFQTILKLAVALSAFTLCDHPHCPSPGCFTVPKPTWCFVRCKLHQWF